MAFEDRIRLPTLNLIHRRLRLLDLLTQFVEAGHRLVTIYAPGGYGKSILLADFAQTTNLPVCWCSLEPVDRDPTSFLTLLAYSITDRFHEIDPRNLLKLVQQGNTQTSIRRIAELLAGIGPHLIVIDDYHKAVSAGMTLALNKLLEQLPAASTIIVAARGDMMLETGQIIDLLIAERATGLSEEELRFTPDEVQLVMRKRFGRRIDLASAARIATATDGNIAQILLSGHAMHTEKLLGQLSQRLGDDQAVIYGYLAEEVLGKQPPDLQTFLLHTAVLPDMTAELCNELLDIMDAQDRLEELVRRDLFIAQVGAGFRYHDLFAEFLRARLAEDASRHHQVSIRAADLLAARSRFEEAIYLYLSVGAWDKAADLLEIQGSSFYHSGRALTLDSWLNRIPPEELGQKPQLLLLRGQILANDLNQPEAALQLYRQAEAKFTQQRNLAGAAEALVFQANALRTMGYPQDALLAATAGLSQLENLRADKRVIAYAVRSRGLAHWVAGNIGDAVVDLRRALTFAEQLADDFSIARGHHEVGICLEKQGNISGAEYHYQQALKIWETLGNANDLANTLNSLGVCAYFRGDYNSALQRLHDSLDVSLQIGATRRAAFAQASIGDVCLEQAQYAQAIQAFETAAALAREASARSLELYTLAKMAESYFRQDNLAHALTLTLRAKEVAAETGLLFEKALAVALQAKIYTRQAEFAASAGLFAEAVAAFSVNDVLEQAKTRLWWGYSLLLDLKSFAAYEQLQQAISLALSMGELMRSLGPTVRETRPLLLHFLYRPEVLTEFRDNIQLLLNQSPPTRELKLDGIQVFAFGAPYVIVDGGFRQFSQRGGGGKIPEFLLYLLLEGQNSGCRWSDVSLALWPDLDREKASISFHQTLRRLRGNVLGDQDYILLEDDHYRINPKYLHWCDALAFEKLYQRTISAPPDQKLALQFELINLYQGEFLAGFEVGEWGAAYRVSCEARFLQIIKLVSEQLLRTGSPQNALSVIYRGLAHDYFREELHRSALRAYAQAGLFDDLTAHYTQLYQIFEQEFGHPPDPVTTELYYHLLEKT